MVRTSMKLCLAALVPAAGIWAADWVSKAGEGAFDTPENWSTGKVPASGETSVFNAQVPEGTTRVVIPAGGYVDGSSTLLNGLKSGTTVIFDATGTTWSKQRAAGTSWQNWIFRVDNSDHIFNLEGLSAGNAADWFGFTFTDGKISFTADNAGDHLNFESGAFDMAFLPDGTPSNHSAIMGYSPHRANAVVEFGGGTHKLRNVQVRGQAPNSVFRVSGGDHEIWGGLNIKCWDGASDGVVEVTGGSLTVKDNAVWIGKNAQGAGVVRVKGTGTFRNNSGATYFPDVASEQGFIQISERGTYESAAGIQAGHANGSYAEIDVRGEGRLVVNNTLNLAEGGSSSTGRLVVAENAYVSANNLSGAGGAERVAQIELKDDATLAVGGGTVGANDTSLAEFKMTGGNVVMTTGQDWAWGANNRGLVNFIVEDGLFSNGEGGDALGGLNFRGGPGSTVEFRGGKVSLANMRIEGASGVPGYTNTVRQTGGEVNIRQSAGEGLDIRANGRNAMYLLEEGTLRIGRNGGGMFRLGHAGANNGYHAVYRQTGGTSYLGGVVNMCDAGGSDGEFELLGGVCYARDIRGWNGSVYRGNTGWARCYFNGGTLKPYANNVTLVYTMPECALGAQGVVVDTEGLNATFSAKVQNDGAGTANEAEGLFVKAGAGTLTVRMKETDGGAAGAYAGRSLNSDHTFTRVTGGVLQLGDAEDCQFGRNVTVSGGATLSLAGTPKTLHVETLALAGDANGPAILRLDAGDTIDVTTANGFSAANASLDVAWRDQNGIYTVFTCKGAVSPAALKPVKVMNANANKAYHWSVTMDEATGVSVCSLQVKDWSDDDPWVLKLADGAYRTSGTEAPDFDALSLVSADPMGILVINNAVDLSFERVKHTGGILVKKGAGALVLDLPAGNYNLGSSAAEAFIGENGGQIVFDEADNILSGNSGLYGVTILEGALRVRGQGVNTTTLSTQNSALLGSGYKGEVPAVLDVANARINWGAGSRHGCIMRDQPAGTPPPEVRLENAYFWSDSPTLGSGSADKLGPKLIMKNSTYWGHYNAYIGSGSSRPEIDADNSRVESDGQIGWTIAALQLTADFYGENAAMGSLNDSNIGYQAGIFACQDHVTGTLKFRDGAHLNTTRGVRFANGQLDVVFDGGVFAILQHRQAEGRDQTSVWNRAGKGFTSQGKGLTIDICAGSTHAFNFPVYGEGPVTKAGAGTFKLVEPRAEGETLLQATGLTTVAEGTLVVDGAAVAETARFAVAAGATLDLNASTVPAATLAGAGTVANGTLKLAMLKYDEAAVPTLANATFAGEVLVDFARTAEDPLDADAAKEGVVVARYTGTAPAALKLKAVNTGLTGKTRVAVEGGEVKVALGGTPGCLILVH